MSHMSETRHQRFERLATKRVNRILNDLRLLGNLSNRSSYDYTDSEIQKIFSAIDSASKHSKSKFTYVKRVKFQL
jgi:hypothetical protein